MPSDRAPPSPINAGSAARQWVALDRFIDAEASWANAAEAAGGTRLALYEFFRFGVKQAWACLFGAVMLCLMIATSRFYPAHPLISRYDFLFMAALLIQIGMLRGGLETWSEAKVILIYHLIGTIMELHKTNIGSWVYPGPSVIHIAGVPLFTGFMYAAVGSYLARVWRLFDFRFTRHPPLPGLALLSTASYINFLTDHLGYDVRYILLGAAAVLFAPATIFFKVWRRHRQMPLLLGLVLVSLFIWIAENIGTFTNTWLYPQQAHHWTMVPISKLTSWLLLMIVSYTLVAWINGIRPMTTELRDADAE